MQFFLILFLTFVSDLSANDGTVNGYAIWEDLNITSQQYYELSGWSGMTMGFVFALSIVLILTKR